MAFPSNPTNGQTFTEDGVNYSFNSQLGVWKKVIIPAVTTLDGLSDVTTSGQTTGQVLGYDGTTWKPITPVAPITNLNDISDVDVYNLVNGEYLKYDETSNTWTNGPGTYNYDLMMFDPATNILSIGFGEESTPTLTTDLSALAGGGGVDRLDLLSDTYIATPSSRQFLVHDGDNWVNRTVGINSGDLSDVNTNVTPAAGNVLTWNATLSVWEAKAPTAAATTLDSLTDVNTAGQTAGQVLTYDGTTWKPVTPTGGSTPAKTMITMTTNNIDLGVASYFKKTITGATVLTVSNAPISGTVGSFMIELVNAASNITWFAGIKWAGGLVPTLTATGTDVLGFTTYDGGTTYIGVLISKAIA